MIASFDLGTSALKCAVVDNELNLIESKSVEIKTYRKGSFIEQNPEEWWQAFKTLSATLAKDGIDSIIFSGQMQDLYFLDSSGNAIGNAILYNDQRGRDYVSTLPSYVSEKTSIALDGSIPIAKMLFLRDNDPSVLSKAEKLLISAKDYLIYKLTGRAVSDVTSMSTSGMMDIKTKEYIDVSPFFNPSLLPDILHSEEVAGTVTKEASAETGFKEGIDVYAGAGDAGSSTLASGVVSPGDFSINLGTSGWVAAVSDHPVNGVFNLAAIPRDSYINVIPVLNAANVHKWISNLLFNGDEDRYSKLHELLVSDTHSNPSLLCLPYLTGERFPVADDRIRGAYVGLDMDTTLSDLARSALEGVAFSLRMGLESHGLKPSSVHLIGGGANESVWNKIFASVFSSPVTSYKDSEHLSSIALASSVLLSRGIIKEYRQAIDTLLARQESRTYLPEHDMEVHYDTLYERFTRLYPTLKTLF